MSAFVRWFHEVSLQTLSGIAVGCAFVVGGTRYVSTQKLHDRIKQAHYYTKSVQILEEHPQASAALGPPLTTGRLHLGWFRLGKDNIISPTGCAIRIPVEGSLDKGHLCVVAQRDPEPPNAPWKILSLELELDNAKKTYTIYEDST